jgi:hypothetical protein
MNDLILYSLENSHFSPPLVQSEIPPIRSKLSSTKKQQNISVLLGDNPTFFDYPLLVDGK